MKYKRVCSEHENLYTDWLCDTLQCEPCLRRSDKCVRFSVLLSISDQGSCYENSRPVSSSLWDTLDDQGKLSYPMRHIHNVAQASLKSGTHFDGHFRYDSKDLWIAACTSNEQQHSMIFQGLSKRALSQLDKHSEALQRVSDPVISTLESIFCFIKTDIPELYKPWTSTSSNHSTLIGDPLFIVISRHGVAFYTDNNKAGLHYCRQTPVQRKVYTVSCGFLKHDEDD